MYKNNITHSLLFTRKMLRFRIFALENMNLRKWYRMDDSLSDYPYLRVLRTKNLNRLKLVGGEKFQKEILYPSLIRHHNWGWAEIILRENWLKKWPKKLSIAHLKKTYSDYSTAYEIKIFKYLVSFFQKLFCSGKKFESDPFTNFYSQVSLFSS